MSDRRVPVLIIGGGSCGLASSLFLADLGIESLLVERHTDTSLQAKANYLNQRTMEVFRQYGIAGTIYAEGAPLSTMSRVRWCTTLAGSGPLDGRELHSLASFGGGETAARYERDSACRSTSLSLMFLEPLLRREAEARNPGRILFGHELTEFDQDDSCVHGKIQDLASGELFSVSAQYMIGADGGRMLASALGIAMLGDANVRPMITTHFEADLSSWVPNDTQYTRWINPDEDGNCGTGFLVGMGPSWGSASESWKMTRRPHPEEEGKGEEFRNAFAAELIPRLLGIPDLDIKVRSSTPWSIEAVVAERFRSGRIFLAGDAAHRHPPTAGLGLNSAVQDAHNLTWKLKAVLSGAAADALLDSFEAERQAATQHNADWAFMTSEQDAVNMAAMGLHPGQSSGERRKALSLLLEDSPMGETRRAKLGKVLDIMRMEFQAHDVEIGFGYPRGAFLPDASAPPPRDPMGGIYYPVVRPGHRLPHAWLQGANRRISTHDLVKPGRFVLLAGDPRASAWQQAADEAGADAGLALDFAHIGSDGGWQVCDNEVSVFGQLDDGGAVLVRPDAYVAWSCPGSVEDIVNALSDALERILARHSADVGAAF